MDPWKLTVHQTLMWYDLIEDIELSKAGETNHRRKVEQEAKRQARMSHDPG